MTPDQDVAMNVKDKLTKAMEAVDRALWKLVGAENEILFHFLRVVLACVLLAVLLALALGVVVVLWMAVSVLLAAMVAAAPYLVAIAVFLGLVALWGFHLRREERNKIRETERQNDLKQQAEERQRARNQRIRESLLAADAKTMNSMEAVLASLRRFDHRLEVAITPAHYTDLFGDNWVNVREFAESPQGRSVPDMSALLVGVMILYKQAQDLPWIPENLRLMQSVWGEASKKRKLLSDLLEAAQAQIASGHAVLKAEILEERIPSPIPEMAVTPPPAALLGRPQRTASVPEMAVQPPPAPPKMLPPQPPRAVAVVGPAPKLSVPPTLEELQRYCIWVNGGSEWLPNQENPRGR